MEKLIYTKSDLFLIFYTLAYFLNETEKWDRPLFALASIGFLIGVLFSQTRNYTFTVFLFFSLIHILSDFPKSSNHFNVMLFVNILLILSFSIRYKLRIKEYTLNSNDFLTLRWFLILVYFFTGFHKLNDDFLFSDCPQSGFPDFPISRFHLFPISRKTDFTLFFFRVLRKTDFPISRFPFARIY